MDFKVSIKDTTPLRGRILKSSSGGAGTDNYNDLRNKPSINGVPLVGNKTSEELRISGALSDALKQALLQLAQQVAYVDANGQTYYDDLYAALYPPAGLISISAVFTQGQTVVYDTDSLDSLKLMLTVTANYDDGSSSTVPSTDYTLSGTLTPGTSTITVSYGGKTTTFAVTVTSSRPHNYIDDAIHVFTGQYMQVNPDYYFYQLTDSSRQNAYVIPITAGTYRLLIKDTSQYNNVPMGSNQFNNLGKQWFSISENDLSNATTNRTTDNTIEAPTFGEFTNLGLQEDGTYHRYVDVTYSKAGYIALSLVQDRGDWSLTAVVSA